MKYEIKCSVCGRKTNNPLDYICECGKPLQVYIYLNFEIEKIKKEEFTVWRYLHVFPYINKDEIVTLGEGWTPLVKASKNLYFKLENLNPTGSFKDRGSTVLISRIHKLVREKKGFITEDSSGNAGASIAAYSANVGLKAKIYVPENVSGQKFNQIKYYGAEIVKVSGSRNRVTEEAQKPEAGKFYIGHVFHPLFRDGIRTLAYEIAEQFKWQVPERIYLPVSAGTLLLGVIEGFKHLKSSEIITEIPKIVACQTMQVSPLYHHFKNAPYTPPKKITSIADALVSVNPPLLEIMVKSLREIKGEVEVVDEDDIRNCFHELARRGFFVEPSSAVAYAAYKKQFKSKQVSDNQKALVILTGNGLKTTL